jgi:regulatory protein
MPTITRLRRRGRSGTLLTVELDGQQWVALDEGAVVRLGYHVGLELDGEARRAGEQEARVGAAERRAARLLASRAHSRHELETKLRRTAGRASARAVVERFDEHGFLDDDAFARRLAVRRLAQGYGPERIAADLERAGIASGPARAVLEALEPADVEQALRRALGDTTVGAGWQRLLRRGFSEDLIEDLLGARDDADDGAD